MTESPMMVSSDQLTMGATAIRASGAACALLADERTLASAPQLDTAAQLLRDAEPSICNLSVSERPGWIVADSGEDEAVLVFEVGILPSTRYRIDRDGLVLHDPA